MTRFVDRQKARVLRLQGKSYAEIGAIVRARKGTLHEWLKDMPLSAEQMRQVRDLNPRRIENFRETMRKKKEAAMTAAYNKARKEIGALSRRDLFIAGIYLYWAEGTKSARGRSEIANTDPAVIKAFLQWLMVAGVPKDKIRIRLQLYKDMSIASETRFWSKTLDVPVRYFRKPAIKESRLTGLTRKHGHGHGTCDLIFDNVPMWEYITGALKYIRECHMRP